MSEYPQATQTMNNMITVLLTYDVNDFLEWKTIFNKNKETRIINNIKVKGVYIDLEDHNKITTIVEAPSKEAFIEHFFNQPNIAGELIKCAINKQPEIKYIKNILPNTNVL
jgi:hypothetical protein